MVDNLCAPRSEIDACLIFKVNENVTVSDKSVVNYFAMTVRLGFNKYKHNGIDRERLYIVEGRGSW